MASRTYRERVIVLRKTRLREADLVLTLLAQDGRQVRAVAKGALKPTGSFASRLELYSCADVLLVEGRSLDIVKEARLVDAHAPLRFDYERSICAAPMAELLSHATQGELPVERLFPMTQAAFASLARVEVARVRLVMSAFLLKAASLLGFRPSLAQCAECGEPRPMGAAWRFSFAAGGVLCQDCAVLVGDIPGMNGDRLAPAVVTDWANALIHATFSQVESMDADAVTQTAVARFAGTWIEAHLAPLKSLSFAYSL
jgi:DNA repair protein RecO (recombination protein O)